MKRPNGWDERDYKFWSDLQQLPSFGLIAPSDHSVSFDQVVALMKKHAEARFEEQWNNAMRCPDCNQSPCVCKEAALLKGRK